jgi:hypothetical protein
MIKKLHLIVFTILAISACDKVDQKLENQKTPVSTTPPELPTTLLSDKIVNTEKVFIEKACYLDTINATGGGKYQIKPGQVITLNGWAFNPLSGSEPSHKLFAEFLEANSSIYYKALRSPREDVARAFKNKKINNSGFMVTILTDSLSPGIYKIRIVQLDQNQLLICDLGWNLLVKP